MKKFFVFFVFSFLSLQISNQKVFAGGGSLRGDIDPSAEEVRMDPDARRRIIDGVIARATGNWVDEELAKLKAFKRKQEDIRSRGQVSYQLGLGFLNEPPTHPLRLAPNLNSRAIAQYLQYFWARELKITEADVAVGIVGIGEIGVASVRVLGIADGVTVEKWGKSLTAKNNEVARILLAKTQEGWVEISGSPVSSMQSVPFESDPASTINLAKVFADSVDLANYHRDPDPLDSKKAEEIAMQMTQDLYTILRFKVEALGLGFQSTQDVFNKIYQSILRDSMLGGSRATLYYGGQLTQTVWGKTLDLNQMWRDIVSLEEHINLINMSLDRLEAFGTAEGVNLGLVTEDGFLTRTGAQVLEVLRASLHYRLARLDGLAEKFFQVNGTWLTDFEKPEGPFQVSDLKLTKDGHNGKVPVTMTPQTMRVKPWMFHGLAKKYGAQVIDVLTRIQYMEPLRLKIVEPTRVMEYEVRPQDFQLSWNPGANTLESYVAKYAKIARRVAKYNPSMLRIMTYEKAQHVT